MYLIEPIIFEPLFMERVWGGRRLESLYGKKLPKNTRVGESWEVVDREEAQSVVHSGEHRGRTLHELWSKHRAEVFGERFASYSSRFPLLIKLLDADERLSVQVHPPASQAEALKGEPKTEMWFVTYASAKADLFAGLKEGTTRAAFQRALEDGSTADLLHRLPTKAGDCIFIPSGRIHAIGAGNVILEVQQNSDTTYRVFDWNRVGLDGKPRQLHIEESMRSIDFDDFEPRFQPTPCGSEPLVACPYFAVAQLTLKSAIEAAPKGEFSIIAVISGSVQFGSETFKPGSLFLVPASSEERLLSPVEAETSILKITLP